MKTKKILITGGAGYIGSHTALAAISRGYSLAVIDNLSTGTVSVLPEQAIFYEQDLANSTAILKILKDFKPDAVIHFAGSIILTESVTNPIKYYQNNLITSLNLIDACVKAKIKHFIFSSTAAVYGIPQTFEVTEETPLAPISPYGQSKLIVEKILADVALAHNFNYVALRYFNVAGADAALRSGQLGEKATHLVKVACQSALGMHQSMQVFGSDYPTVDGTCIRDFIHVSDLALAHLAVLDYMQQQPTAAIFNCGNGVGYSVREIIAATERVSGIKLKIELKNRRPGDPPCLIANAAKLKQQTGWQAKYTDIDSIVDTAFKWEKKITPG